MSQDEQVSVQLRWARLKHAIIGELLASPPKHGELQTRIKRLAERTYRHPITEEDTQFGFSTIERWYYDARGADDPIEALRRKRRKDAGKQHLHPELIEALGKQPPSSTDSSITATPSASTDRAGELGSTSASTGPPTCNRGGGLNRHQDRHSAIWVGA